MRWNLKLIVCLIAVLFIAIPVLAQDNSYLLFKGGIYEPNSDDDFDTGFTGEIAYGYHFSRALAIELGLGYLETENDRVPGLGSIDIDSVPLTASLKTFFPINSATSIYGLAGVGAWFTGGEFRIGGLKFDDDDTSFGVQLGAGLNYNFNRSLFFGVEGKYFWTKAEFQALGINVNQNLNGFVVTGNFGIRF